jgi:hypothetical protein
MKKILNWSQFIIENVQISGSTSGTTSGSTSGSTEVSENDLKSIEKEFNDLVLKAQDEIKQKVTNESYKYRYSKLNEELISIASFSVISAILLSLPKVIDLVGVIVRKLSGSEQKNKLEKFGEKLHHIYIKGIANIIKFSVKTASFGKSGIKDETAEKWAKYLYWVALIVVGYAGATSLATHAGHYSLSAAVVKSLTTLTKAYDVSLIIVALYLMFRGHVNTLEDGVHAIEKCIEDS